MMKKPIVLFCVFLLFLLKNSFGQEDVDRGVSYDLRLNGNENITIPLYNVQIEGASVPIFLSYNSKGSLVTNLPSSTGYGWNLQAGGEIEKEVNHLVDESPDGWFFHNRFEDLEPEVYGINRGRELFETVDTTPDIFVLSMSNGFSIQYLFDRSGDFDYSDPVILKQSRNVASITTDFDKLRLYGYGNYQEDIYTSDDDFDIRIGESSGANYLFRKGVKRNKPWDLERKQRTYIDSSDIQNYYVHKITTDFNKDYINFEYYNTDLLKYILHGKATRFQTNSDPRNPPGQNDPIITEGYESQISVQDESRKDIKKIISPYETIEFIYVEREYYTSFNDVIQSPIQGIDLEDYERQKFKLLDEIIIKNHRGEYISGYKFNYTEQTQNQEDYEGNLRLKSILKYGKNHKNTFVYRKFDYYKMPSGQPYSVSMAQDVFGYPNGATNNSEANLTPVYIHPIIADKMPDQQEMIKGMLKSVTNPLGGKTEYVYKENTSGELYFGGLIMDKVNTYDENSNLIGAIEYVYEDPEGYGIEVYDQDPIQQGQVPDNMYEKGYYEEGLRTLGWQTYFTKRDPWMDRNNLPYLTAYTVSNIPYAFHPETPTVDNYLNTLQLQNFRQIETGSFYKKVTTRRKNVVTNQFEKGSVIRYYRPSLSGFRLSRLLERIEYLDIANKIRKETIYTYELVEQNLINAFKFDNVHYTGDTHTTFRYNLESFPIYDIKDVLRSVETKNYDDYNNVLIDKKEFLYLNENANNNLAANYDKVKSSTQFINNVLNAKVDHKYLSEYDNVPLDFQGLFYKNPVVETNQWRYDQNTWKLVSSSTISYLYDGKPHKVNIVNKNPQTGDLYTGSNFTSSYFDIQGNLQSTGEVVTEYQYDENGKLKAQKDVLSEGIQIYQRGAEYDGLYMDAILSTKLPVSSNLDEIFLKKSFENSSEANVIRFLKAFSGDYVYSGTNISLGTYPSGYIVSYWSYDNTKWSYHSNTHQGGEVTIQRPEGAIYIDEVRIQPLNSLLQSYTLRPLIGQTSILDNRGDGNRIEYDVFNSAIFYKDENQNVLIENRLNLIELND